MLIYKHVFICSVFELNCKTGKGGETEILDSIFLHKKKHTHTHTHIYTPIVFYIFNIKVVGMHAKSLQ